MKPGVLFFNDSSDLCVLNNDALRGRRVHGISGGSNLYALCDDGIRDAVTGEQIGKVNTKPTPQLGKLNAPPVCASSGGKANILATDDGKLYSWGTGRYGELGLGASKIEINLPSEIIIAPELPKPIVQVSCGNGHAFAIDSVGNLYGWGQNFDKQLGLYTKQIEELSKHKTVSIEEMMFLPRFIPISLKYPIKKVSCGGNFTVVITVDGQILSWGAGECGQLGTGRCTFKILPSSVELPTPSNNPLYEETGAPISRKAIDIACGAGHVICCTETGNVFSWGLNKRGQLGLMNTSTQHNPMIITSLQETSIMKVYAEGNSSACVNSVGRLYTWGSGSYYRLMHGTDTHFHRPKLVQALEKNAVETFAFSKTRSCALVPTCIKNCFPISGPQKTFSKLDIYGDGFWDSENIIIKFNSSNGSTFAPPRSCIGRLTAPGVITCKPPKLGDTGDFIITISMDGENFMPEQLRVNIYKDVTLASTSPKVIDYRKNDTFDISIKVKGLPLGAALPDYFDVKLVMTSQSTMSEQEVVVKGQLVDLPSSVETEDPSLAGSTDLERSLSLDELQDDVIEKPVDRYIVCSVKASEICDLSSNNLYIIRAKVSLNGQDFSDPTPESESTLCHAFTVVTAQPDCYPYSLEPCTNELKVSGHSFLSKNNLSENCVIQAVIRADFGEKEYGLREIVTTVSCDNVNELYFTPPSYLQLIQGKQIIEESNDKKKKKQPTKKIDINKVELPTNPYMTASVIFQLTATTENADSTKSQSIDTLSVSPLELRLFKPVGVLITPSVCRRIGGLDLVIKGTDSSPITFQSSFAKICFTRVEYGISLTTEALLNELEPSIYEYKVVCPCFEKQQEETKSDADGVEGTEITDNVDGEAAPIIENAEVSGQEEPIVQPPIDYVIISALLDGITPVDESLSCKLSFFDALNVVSTVVPKGGGAPGNPIPVTVERMVQSDSCVVRLRGVEEGSEGVLCPATMQLEASTVTFTVPDAASVATLTAEVRGKEKWYFVDVSIDGGISFDNSETAILNLK